MIALDSNGRHRDMLLQLDRKSLHHSSSNIREPFTFFPHGNGDLRGFPSGSCTIIDVLYFFFDRVDSTVSTISLRNFNVLWYTLKRLYNIIILLYYIKISGN